MKIVLFIALALAVGCDGGSSGLDDAQVLDDALVPDGGAPDAEISRDAENPGDAADPGDAEGIPPDMGAPSPFQTRPGVLHLSVWGAEPDAPLELLAPDGTVIEADADHLGSKVFRDLVPGEYSVRLAAEPALVVHGLRVMSAEESQPDQSFYDSQVLSPGFGYLTTRDGTQLSVFVSLPGPPEDGPYPTLVNYSGYSPSQPGVPLGGAAEALCGSYPVLCAAPSYPTGIIGGVMGYATVGVNVRGTGCSGGAYDYFDLPQVLDGYDVIEIVAAQPWVKHNRVGMAGLSYPGITQLFVAAQQPPSLAAITPMSIIADTTSSTLAPGGIYNNGFALEWIEHVLDRARPYGHQWIRDVVDAGDTLCEENQLLHDQRLDAVAKALANPYYTDEIHLPVDPSAFVDQITVPVFLVGQWQDEQTGPHFAVLADKFVNAPVFKMSATNGVHIDGLAPQVLVEWSNFLSLYVARETPRIDPVLRSIVPVFMQSIFGARLELAPDRFADLSFDEALAAYEAEPPIRILFESGAPAEVEPGAPHAAFSVGFDAWPIPATVPRRWFLQPDGSLAPTLPGPDGGASAFEHDPEAGARGTVQDGSINDLQPGWRYEQPIEGKALAFISAPLDEDLVMVGHGSVDLWIRSTADDADLEVGLTEVRADGQESYVQTGWLRASHRALRGDATELRPVKTHREADIAPLPPGEWTEARVELMPFAHVFRAGSRIRLVIDTPGDSMAAWRFLLLDHEVTPTHAVAHAEAFPSSIALPVIPDVAVPTEQADCHRLRGQPCREYAPLENPPAP